MLTLLLVLSTVAFASSENFDHKNTNKRSYYVCPPDFMRLGNKCYFFSNNTATWQDAYFHCKDLHSNLAIIKSAHQNKILRMALSKDSIEPFERWVGGYFDWQQKEWKWAPSGKPMLFQGFSQMSPEEQKMDWQKAILDPNLQYKWSARSAFEKKHFICQTNLKNVNHKGKRKLQKVYNATKYKKLNEVPVPEIYDPDLPNDIDPNIPLQHTRFSNDINYEVNVLGDAAFAKRTNEETKMRRQQLKEERKKKREERRRLREERQRQKEENRKHKRNHKKHLNNTLDDGVDMKSSRKQRNRRKEHNGYHNHDKSTEIPLHPRKIVEDLSDFPFNDIFKHNESEKHT